MLLAGHSESSTTHGFYLAIPSDLIDLATTATVAIMGAQIGTPPISG
jgi:hypothetical protein